MHNISTQGLELSGFIQSMGVMGLHGVNFICDVFSFFPLLPCIVDL